jgi:hypothetical protein
MRETLSLMVKRHAQKVIERLHILWQGLASAEGFGKLKAQNLSTTIVPYVQPSSSTLYQWISRYFFSFVFSSREGKTFY